MTDGDQVRVLSDASADDFRQMLAIYQEAIEKSEQKPASAIARLVREPNYIVLVAGRENTISGCAMAFFPKSGTFWLLEYLATRRDLRSRGTGRQLFFAAKSAAQTRCPDRPCIIEADQPHGQVTPANDPVRRLRFYRTLGCRTIQGLDYILPLATAGQPPPMQLLVHGLDEQTRLPRETIEEWLNALYTEVYDQQTDDPRIGKMLSSARDGADFGLS